MNIIFQWLKHIKFGFSKSNTRLGDWIQTYTGKAFFPFDPLASDVDIADIAHSLACQSRFAGHTKKPYSIAQHSVYVMRVFEQLNPNATTQDILAALLHDATEAYIIDLPRPIKHNSSMWKYRKLEENVEKVIAQAFDLKREQLSSAFVKMADNIVLATEARDLMLPPPRKWKARAKPLNEHIESWDWEYAEKEFLTEFFKLKIRIENEKSI